MVAEPVVLQRQAPMIQKVLKTVEFPQVQYVDEIVDEPVVMQGQVPTTQTVQKTGEASQVQFPDRVADVPVVSRRHVPGLLIQEEIVEVIRVVDSEDLPLDISGETLLQNKILRVIKKNHVTKYLEMLAETAELKDDNKNFYEQRGKCPNFGNDEDSTVGVKTAEVLRFNTSKFGDEQSSFEEYVDRMKEGQNDISCITGESIAVESSSPFLENLRKNGYDPLHVTDPMNEYAVHQPKEFDGKMLKSTTTEGLDLGDEDEKKTLEEPKAEFKPLTELMKEVPGDKVEEAIVDDRTVDSLRVLTTSGLSANMKRTMKAQVSLDSGSQQHNSNQPSGSQQQLQATQQERKERRKEKGEKVEGEEWETVVVKGRKGQRGRGQEGRKEEEKEAEEGGGERVKKDMTDWTVVTRNRRQRKMVQIFVRVNGSNATPMDVNLANDKVEDVMRRIQNDEDASVTMQGKVLRTSEKLKSCGVTDGCTIQVTSRMRRGGRHKVKKSKESAKTERMEHRVDRKDDEVEGVARDSAQLMGKGSKQRWADEVKSDKGPAIRECDKDAVIQMTEQNEVCRKIVESLSAGNDFEVEWMMQECMREACETLGWTQEQAKMIKCGIGWVVEARRKGRGEEKEQEQRRREETLEETQVESTDEPEVTSRVAEMKTGRGSASLVQGGGGRT